VQKVIELLEYAMELTKKVETCPLHEGATSREALGLICAVIKTVLCELKDIKAPPRWETPEQHKERTEEGWPDDWPVYLRAQHTTEGWGEWHVAAYSVAKREKYEKQIACFTEAGAPPDDWKPEDSHA
jgi:hypothetical protein